MIWATVSSWSCFCWLYGASPSLAAENIINLISVLTIWWCPCVESSLCVVGRGCLYKSRSNWSNRPVWPWSKKWSRAKANRVFPREHTGHHKHPLPTTQVKTLHMDITRWSIQKWDRLYSLQPKIEKLFSIFSKNKTWSWLWLRSLVPYHKI